MQTVWRLATQNIGGRDSPDVKWTGVLQRPATTAARAPWR